MDKWEELKEWIQRQYSVREKATSPAEVLLKGFFKSVKDKMWSLEKKN